MNQVTHKFHSGETTYLFNGSIESLPGDYNEKKLFVLTDEIIYRFHEQRLKNFVPLVLPPGEANKTQATIDYILNELIKAEADKATILVGIGGGVITDIAGYAASIFKRGMQLVLAPTTILAMVDAAIGGKNGINIGPYKNMAGTIYQPAKIIFDYNFLNTLPKDQWINGFAEIIKHACIQDEHLFEFLETHNLDEFIQNKVSVATLIEENVHIKTQIVLEDEQENNKRKLLNFGHTIGHAIETNNHLPHGHAISIGMVIAAIFSEEINMFSSAGKERLVNLLSKYGLPVNTHFKINEIWERLIMDKKRHQDAIDFILLDKIGTAKVQNISLIQLKDMIEAL